MQKLYALHDSDLDLKEKYGMFVVSQEQAERLNDEGYGIFKTVNEFDGARRISNITKINSWYCEIDDGDKSEALKKINACPIIPSKVVETKRGYHIYFHCLYPTIKNYRIIQDRIINYFNADDKVKDVARVLRAENFYHRKDPAHPFLIKVIQFSDIRYDENTIFYFFKDHDVAEDNIEINQNTTIDSSSFGASNDLNSFLDNLDHEQALIKLSGKHMVNYEVYAFKNVSRGRKNLIVNGRSTSCFIDENKRIGASHGPTVFQWLRYFGHTDKEIYRIIKQEFMA